MLKDKIAKTKIKGQRSKVKGLELLTFVNSSPFDADLFTVNLAIGKEFEGKDFITNN